MPSFCPPSQKYDFDGLKKDQQIEPGRHIFDIEKVIAKLFLRILDRAPVLVTNLSPSRDPRSNCVPQIVMGNLLLQPFHKLWTLWPRPDQTHIAFQDVPKLWNFIESAKPQKMPYSRNSWVIVFSPRWPRICFRVRTHSTEFKAFKNRAVTSHPFLAIQYRP